MSKASLLRVLSSVALLSVTPIASHAQTFATSFSGSGFTCFNSSTPGSCGSNTRAPRLANFIWNTGDYFRQVVSGSGLSSINRLSLNLDFYNFIFAGSSAALDVYVNSSLVGQLPTYTSNFDNDFVSGPLAFDFADIAGPQYTIDLRLRAPVVAGSIALYSEPTSTIVLQQSVVPEPSTYLLMGSGLAALAFAGRRRRRALQR